MTRRSTRRDPIAFIRRHYRRVWGFAVPAADEARIARSGGAETYGQIQVAAAGHLLAALELGPDDVLFDLGSGTGRFVLQAALTTSVGRAVGVELSRWRHDQARAAKAAALAAGFSRARACELRCGDLMRTSLAGATAVYTCATAFPDDFLTRLTRRLLRLPPGLRVASTTPLDPHPRLAPLTTLRLDMSWRRKSPTYLYRTLPP